MKQTDFEFEFFKVFITYFVYFVVVSTFNARMSA